MSNKALVTGASGFVGSNVAKRLVKEGWNVHVIVRPSSNLDLLASIRDDISLHVYNGNMQQMVNIVSQASPDVVFHIASMVVGEHSLDQVDDIISSNVMFGTQLLEAMSINNINRFINTGTYWEHYEGRPYSPVNLYAASKYAFENILKYYIEGKHVNSITLTLFDPYGPDDNRPKLLNLLKSTAETGGVLRMSPGDQKLDLVHISDVADAYVMAAHRLLAGKASGGEMYGVGGRRQVSLKELVAKFEAAAGRKINVVWGARPYRSREVMVPWQDFDSLPGWEPKVQLEEGLASLFSFN